MYRFVLALALIAAMGSISAQTTSTGKKGGGAPAVIIGPPTVKTDTVGVTVGKVETSGPVLTRTEIKNRKNKKHGRSTAHSQGKHLGWNKQKQHEQKAED